MPSTGPNTSRLRRALSNPASGAKSPSRGGSCSSYQASGVHEHAPGARVPVGSALQPFKLAHASSDFQEAVQVQAAQVGDHAVEVVDVQVASRHDEGQAPGAGIFQVRTALTGEQGAAGAAVVPIGYVRRVQRGEGLRDALLLVRSSVAQSRCCTRSVVLKS